MPERKDLPSLVHRSLADWFSGVDLSLPEEGEKKGSFVTLTKDGSLRGCIGYIQPVDYLFRQVYALAREAAFHDWRFPPVKEEELPFIRADVSVLSEFMKIASLNEFVPGRDGIMMIKGTARALFLPEVAQETGWSRDEMLEGLCRKAGLPSDAWRARDVEFYTFTTEVYSDM